MSTRIVTVACIATVVAAGFFIGCDRERSSERSESTNPSATNSNSQNAQVSNTANNSSSEKLYTRLASCLPCRGSAGVLSSVKRDATAEEAKAAGLRLCSEAGISIGTKCSSGSCLESISDITFGDDYKTTTSTILACGAALPECASCGDIP